MRQGMGKRLGTAAGRSLGPGSGESPPALEVCSSLMINIFFLLIRSAWRCLSAAQGGHGHPPGGNTPFGASHGVTSPCAPAPGRGDTANNPPLPSFQNLQSLPALRSRTGGCA